MYWLSLNGPSQGPLFVNIQSQGNAQKPKGGKGTRPNPDPKLQSEIQFFFPFVEF
jgi:hypothetical protein